MIGVIGISYKSAPVEIREKFTFSEKDIVLFIESLKEQKKHGNFVLLSTCNRTEIYFHNAQTCKSGSYNSILRNFIDFWKVNQDIKKHFYSYYDEEAVEHLFKVSSSLDAMVLGEDQIIGQVKEAYRISAEHKFTGAVLNRLFHKAFEVSKQIRTETAINEGALSVSSAAVRLANQIFPELKNHSVFLIGAGETSELVLKCLKKRGNNTIFIANRTLSKAVELAERYNANPIDFKEIKNQLILSDIIITSTASKNYIISKELIEDVLKDRKNKKLVLIDISVPRNIDENIKNLDNVFLYDIDDLEKIVSDTKKKRKAEIEKAMILINKMTTEFYNWMSTINISPVIKSLKEKFYTINKEELESLRFRIPENEYLKVTEYGNYISDKYLGLIIKNLRTLTDDGKNLDYVHFINNLFELENKND